MLTREEYDTVVVPLLDEARREGHRLRCLCEVGADYRGLTPGAAWEDLTLGLRALHLFDGCAVVSDVGWIREASRLAAFLMPCPVRVFDERDRAGAAAWLAGLPEGPGASVRLDPDAGVVVVEVVAPLRAADFDRLAATVDSWLATHEALPGVVVHARAVPGWENIGALMRHLWFVRDHHRRVRRVALAVDGALAGLHRAWPVTSCRRSCAGSATTASTTRSPGPRDATGRTPPLLRRSRAAESSGTGTSPSRCDAPGPGGGTPSGCLPRPDRCGSSRDEVRTMGNERQRHSRPARLPRSGRTPS